MSNGDKDLESMTRAELRAALESATPFWYGGDRQTIVSFCARPEGLILQVDRFEIGAEEQFRVVIEWDEFDTIAADMPKIVASGWASRAAGRPVHVKDPGARRG